MSLTPGERALEHRKSLLQQFAVGVAVNVVSALMVSLILLVVAKLAGFLPDWNPNEGRLGLALTAAVHAGTVATWGIIAGVGKRIDQPRAIAGLIFVTGLLIAYSAAFIRQGQFDGIDARFDRDALLPVTAVAFLALLALDALLFWVVKAFTRMWVLILTPVAKEE